MRTLRDMVRHLFSTRHDRNELPFPRHRDRRRAHIRSLIVIIRDHDARAMESALRAVLVKRGLLFPETEHEVALAEARQTSEKGVAETREKAEDAGGPDPEKLPRQ